MKIAFQSLELNLAHAWKLSRTDPVCTSWVVVVWVSDGTGTNGIGEAAPVARYQESVESVIEFLERVDPEKLGFDSLEESQTYLETVSAGNFAAKCAINVALADGAARRKQKSVSDFLGPGFSERTHVTSLTIGIDSPLVVREKVLVAEEHSVLKIKVGTPFDKKIIGTIREVAPNKRLRLDANEAWNEKEQALEMIEWFARDCQVEFVEQPMPASAPVSDWKWLKSRSPLPIFADESYHSAADIERTAECFHGVNVKLVKAGGMLQAFQALQAARKIGLKTMLGCMIETSVLITAAAHLAELCDFLDLDGNLLITNDPYQGVTVERGFLSFAKAPAPFGLRVMPRRSS